MITYYFHPDRLWTSDSEGCRLRLDSGSAGTTYYLRQGDSWMQADPASLSLVEKGYFWRLAAHENLLQFSGVLTLDQIEQTLLENLTLLDSYGLVASPTELGRQFFLSPSDGERFARAVQRMGGLIVKKEESGARAPWQEKANRILQEDLFFLEKARKGDFSEKEAFLKRGELLRSTLEEALAAGEDVQQFLFARSRLESQVDNLEKPGGNVYLDVLFEELAHFWTSEGMRVEETSDGYILYLPEGRLLLGPRPQFLGGE